MATPLPIPRTESGSTVHDGRFYIMGGIGAWGETLSSFSSYDPVSAQWQVLPDLPEPISHPAAVAANGKIYVVAGFGPLGIRLRGFMFAEWNPLDSLYIFDVKAGTWSRGPSMPEARGAGGATITSNAIWYAGGIGPDRSISGGLFRFDLKSERWSEEPPVPTPRDHLRLESVGNRLYAISGRKDDLRYNLAVTERYDIDVRRWTRVADIPFPRGGLASVVYSGSIYTFGGEQVWTCNDQVERYDPIRNTWTVLGRLPEARHGIQAGVLNGRIHLISGGRHPRVSISGIHRVYRPNPEF